MNDPKDILIMTSDAKNKRTIKMTYRIPITMMLNDCQTFLHSDTVDILNNPRYKTFNVAITTEFNEGCWLSALPDAKVDDEDLRAIAGDTSPHHFAASSKLFCMT